MSAFLSFDCFCLLIQIHEPDVAASDKLKKYPDRSKTDITRSKAVIPFLFKPFDPFLNEFPFKTGFRERGRRNAFIFKEAHVQGKSIFVGFKRTVAVRKLTGSIIIKKFGYIA
jgi:hypothetical protein